MVSTLMRLAIKWAAFHLLFFLRKRAIISIITSWLSIDLSVQLRFFTRNFLYAYDKL